MTPGPPPVLLRGGDLRPPLTLFRLSRPGLRDVLQVLQHQVLHQHPEQLPAPAGRGPHECAPQLPHSALRQQVEVN